MTLRSRIAAVASLSVALGVLAAAVGAYLAVRADLRGQIDSSLRQRAQGSIAPGGPLLGRRAGRAPAWRRRGRVSGSSAADPVRRGVGLRAVRLADRRRRGARRAGLLGADRAERRGPAHRRRRPRQRADGSHGSWHRLARPDARRGRARCGHGGFAAHRSRPRAEPSGAAARRDRARGNGAGGGARHARRAHRAGACRALHEAHRAAHRRGRPQPASGGLRPRRAGAAGAELQRDARGARPFGGDPASADRGRGPRAAHADRLAAGEHPGAAGGRPPVPAGAGEPAPRRRPGARRADCADRRRDRARARRRTGGGA